MEPESLKNILDSHALWLRGSASGKRANLRNAYLQSADLQYANLQSADLRNADLQSADLRNADLRNANLQSADLRNADLQNAYLQSADLQYANLQSADLPPFQICPEQGQFIAFKKVRNAVILTLLISKKAMRTSSLVGRKCRASRVKVLSAARADGSPMAGKKFQSRHDNSFIYEVGKWVEVPDFDPDIRVECTKGIHFFITRQEAVDY